MNRPEPANDRQREIVSKVDNKAKAIYDGLARWDDSIITQMRIAVGFQMSTEDLKFLGDYLFWCRGNPPA